MACFLLLCIAACKVRKLWAKMADKEWRVAMKALHIVHHFAAEGSSEHARNLQESVAVLRTHHDSRRKVTWLRFMVNRREGIPCQRWVPSGSG